MKLRFCFLYLSVLLLLSSCISTQVVQFEVQEPAKITLPIDIARIALVNNAVAQPSDVGVNRIYEGKGEYEMKPLYFDSLSWNTIEMLGSVLDKGKFFNEVSIYNYNTRTDSNWLSTVNLSDSFREEIFEEEEFDGIIAIDRIFFTVNHKVTRDRPTSGTELAASSDTKINVTINCSVYIYNKNSPITNFTVTDSISYQSSFITDPDVFFSGIPQLLLNDLAFTAGETLSYYFAPSWRNEYRIFYCESSRMREAYSYFNNNKWDEAEDILKTEYEKNPNENTKAKLANNMAIVYEVKDKYDTALSWAEKAREHFSRIQKLNEKDQENNRLYIEQLQKRMADSKKLDMQYGKE